MVFAKLQVRKQESAMVIRVAGQNGENFVAAHYLCRNVSACDGNALVIEYSAAD
jgi:hypothetical protein